MKIEGITDVFFDLDHTLWDFDKNSALAFNKILELNHIDIDVNDFLYHYVPINLKYWKLYREEKIEKKALRFGRLNDAFSAIGYQVEEVVINKLSDDYITHLTRFNYLFENTFEILDYLDLNYNLHIITNGFDEVQHKKLAQSNINKYFKTVTNSEMVGVKKPNPKIFNFALQSANSVNSQSVMIGDSYEADIIGAKNIGMEVVFFDIHNTVIDDDIKRIDNLIQLKKYL
ncbi:YjjG family noncanonical pyrimidine nucleotidase [Flavivirga spongiicola]|uniref:YjjG family noncanonical pyrimidine nucleotidase n=1 Tax=Flavivirga spongiicola TaxID=421621 RepID=A0ABU7XSV5_9FLAO|nr:YjjG family noncanonical pyrimidine nucleotidase [Flavivirga sp. MEBiC05379]MDO5978029.1 YjjG family noncanonical pyrimidine nucleotidase [Flavivirga sp. MEBiC05379]